MRARTVSIMIPDGDPKSIRICDIDNSDALAIAIPRSRISSVGEFEEINRPGIYFLFGDDDELGFPQVYIGEADPLKDRFADHNKSKDFWNLAICITSSKDLNKAQIKYLENLSYITAKSCKRSKLENKNTPTKSSLGRKDVYFCDNFFEDVKLIMTTLGFSIFRTKEASTKEVEEYYCKSLEADGVAVYSDEGMLVKKGSKAILEVRPGLGKTGRRVRQTLIDEGIMKKEKDHYIFTKDWLFPSPSQAGDILCARSTNGWTAWKTKEGKTLDEMVRLKKNERIGVSRFNG